MPVAQPCGEYLTPPFYAAAAHQYLLRALAVEYTASPYNTHDWWDMFAGTGRLLEPLPATMSGRVYGSTLAQADLDTLRELPLFKHAHLFRYDYLNQPDEELPHELRDSLRLGSRWVFLLNPPFAGNGRLRGERQRADLDTAVRIEMLPRRLGRASLNLTTQGLYRLLQLVKAHDLDATVGVFSQASIWVGEGYKGFRDLWQSELAFAGGFLFPAREFEGVAGEWAAAFTTWRPRADPKPFVLDVMEHGKVVGRKELRPADQPLGSWVPRPKSVIAAPQMTSALSVATGKRTRREKLAHGALGYVTWLGNDVRNSKGTCLMSAPSGQAGWSITAENFERSMVAAAARMLVKPSWLNDADQFSAPDLAHPDYQQFLSDAVVWLIGSVGNQTVSLGGVEYKSQTFDIPNHFFFIPPSDMLKIKDLPEQVRAACETAEPRFLSLWLRNRVFTEDAEHILAELKRIVGVTAAARPLADPNLQLDRRWDGSWFQIRRGLLSPSECYTPPPNILRRYRSYKRHHKRLGERLTSQLCDLGFLPRPLLPHARAQAP